MEKNLFEQRLSDLLTLLNQTTPLIKFSKKISGSFEKMAYQLRYEIESYLKSTPPKDGFEKLVDDLEGVVAHTINEYLTKAANEAHLTWKPFDSTEKNPILLLTLQLEEFAKQVKEANLTIKPQTKKTKKKKRQPIVQEKGLADEIIEEIEKTNNAVAASINLSISADLKVNSIVFEEFQAFLTAAEEISLEPNLIKDFTYNKSISPLLAQFITNEQIIAALKASTEQLFYFHEDSENLTNLLIDAKVQMFELLQQRTHLKKTIDTQINNYKKTYFELREAKDKLHVFLSNFVFNFIELKFDSKENEVTSILMPKLTQFIHSLKANFENKALPINHEPAASLCHALLGHIGEDRNRLNIKKNTVHLSQEDGYKLVEELFYIISLATDEETLRQGITAIDNFIACTDSSVTEEIKTQLKDSKITKKLQEDIKNNHISLVDQLALIDSKINELNSRLALFNFSYKGSLSNHIDMLKNSLELTKKSMQNSFNEYVEALEAQPSITNLEKIANKQNQLLENYKIDLKKFDSNTVSKELTSFYNIQKNAIIETTELKFKNTLENLNKFYSNEVNKKQLNPLYNQFLILKKTEQDLASLKTNITNINAYLDIYTKNTSLFNATLQQNLTVLNDYYDKKMIKQFTEEFQTEYLKIFDTNQDLKTFTFKSEQLVEKINLYSEYLIKIKSVKDILGILKVVDENSAMKTKELKELNLQFMQLIRDEKINITDIKVILEKLDNYISDTRKNIIRYYEKETTFTINENTQFKESRTANLVEIYIDLPALHSENIYAPILETIYNNVFDAKLAAYNLVNTDMIMCGDSNLNDIFTELQKKITLVQEGTISFQENLKAAFIIESRLNFEGLTTSKEIISDLNNECNRIIRGHISKSIINNLVGELKTCDNPEVLFNYLTNQVNSTTRDNLLQNKSEANDQSAFIKSLDKKSIKAITSDLLNQFKDTKTDQTQLINNMPIPAELKARVLKTIDPRLTQLVLIQNDFKQINNDFLNINYEGGDKSYLESLIAKTQEHLYHDHMEDLSSNKHFQGFRKSILIPLQNLWRRLFTNDKTEAQARARAAEALNIHSIFAPQLVKIGATKTERQCTLLGNKVISELQDLQKDLPIENTEALVQP